MKSFLTNKSIFLAIIFFQISVKCFVNDTPYEIFWDKNRIPPYSEKSGYPSRITVKKVDGTIVEENLGTRGYRGLRLSYDKKTGAYRKSKKGHYQFIFVGDSDHYWRKHRKYIEAAPKDGTPRQPTPTKKN